MKRNQYMAALEQALKARRVPDIDDILAEYAQHFEHKRADGFTEEEIAARLAKPEAIAAQFAELAAGGETAPRQTSRVLVGVGLVCCDVGIYLFYTVIWGFLIVLGAFSIAVGALAALLLLRGNIAGLIPPMPYPGAALMGISFAGLTLLSVLGTRMCFLYSRLWYRGYLRWRKNSLTGAPYPPYAPQPPASRRGQRATRLLTAVSLLVFGVFLTVAFIVLTVEANFGPFWHVFGWFGGSMP